MKTYIKSQNNVTYFDYIESTGTQYIDTGISGIVRAEISCEFTSITPTAQNAILWSENSGSPWGCNGTRVNSQTYTYFQVGSYGTAGITTATNAVVGTKYLIDVDTNPAGYSLTVNNNLIVNGTASGDLTANNLYLFANNQNGTATQYSKIKLYYCKIWQNNKLVRYFIPVKVGNKVCLLDKITNKYFYNQGTKNFIEGNEKTTQKILIYPVEYIESSGTQCINTGICVDGETQFEADFQYTNITSSINGWVAGTYNNGQRYYPLQLSSKTKFRSGKANNTNLFEVNSDTNRHTLIYNAVGRKVYYDGQDKGTLTAITQTSNQPLFLFSTSDGAEKNEGMKLYSCKIFNNNTQEIYRNYIPVRTEDNEYCLYDRVSHLLFKNQDFDNFLGGEDLEEEPIMIEYNPTGYYKLDALFIGDTRYIDTGVKANPLTRVVMDCKWENVKNQNRFFSTGKDWSNASDGMFMQCYINGSGNFAYAYNQGSGSWKQAGSGVTVAANTRYTVDLDGKNKTFKVSNGASISETLSYTTLPTTCSKHSILLKGETYWTTNSTGTSDNNMYIYSCKIYDNGILIKDFVPIEFDNYIFEDGGFGLLDQVNNIFYPVQGFRAHIRYANLTNMHRTSDLIKFTGVRPITQMYGTPNSTNQIYVPNFRPTSGLVQLNYVDTLNYSINTELKLTTNSKLVLDFSLNALAEQNRLFDFPNSEGFYGGAYLTSGTDCLNCWVNKTNAPGNWNGPTPTTTTTKTTLTFDIQNNKHTLTGGMSYTGTNKLVRNTPIASKSGDLYLFSSSGPGNYTSMRFYSLKVYENGVLTNEIIPVKDLKTEECFIYNKTINKKYINLGTGTLTPSQNYSPIPGLLALPGTFYDGAGSHTISTNYNGFTLIGRANSGGDPTKYIKWIETINTSIYKRLTFLAQMTKVHGYVFGGLYDGTNYYTLWNSGPLNYHTMRAGTIYWKKFDIDLSGFNGVYQVWFCGARDDNSGNTDSATSYRDITFIGAKEVKKAYVNVQGANLLVGLNGINYGGLETTPTTTWTNPCTTTFYKRGATEPSYTYSVATIANTSGSSTSHGLFYWSLSAQNMRTNFVTGYNNKYYLRAEVKNEQLTTSGGFGTYVRAYPQNEADFIYFGAFTNLVTGNWEIASTIKTISKDTPLKRICPYGGILGNTTVDGEKGYIRNIGLYNLTAMFGPGNEPTKAWCDANFTYGQPYGDSLNLILNKKQEVELTKVTAIESRSTTNYINTSLCMPYGFRATGELEFTEIVASTWHQIFGSQTAGEPYMTNGFRIDNNGHFALGESESTMTPVINTRYSFDLSTRVMNSYLKINGNTIITEHRYSSNANYISNYPLYLFSINSAGNAQQGTKMKLYWLKIYDAQNNIIADYIPVKYGSEETAVVLYDKIAKQIYFPNGTFYADTTETETITKEIYTGVPRLTFERNQIINFKISDQYLIPRSWIATSIESNYYSREAYSPLGYWVVRAGGQYSTSYPPYKALDGNDSTYWRSSTIASGGTNEWVLSCPQPICPKGVTVRYRYGGSSSDPMTFEGYNVDTHSWEVLYTMPVKTSVGTETLTLDTNKFCSAFKFRCHRYNSSNTYAYLYTFDITEGKIMLTPGLDGGQAGYQTFTNL